MIQTFPNVDLMAILLCVMVLIPWDVVCGDSQTSREKLGGNFYFCLIRGNNAERLDDTAANFKRFKTTPAQAVMICGRASHTRPLWFKF